MKAISDPSTALMKHELYRVHSLQSQAMTDTLSASESSFGTAEHACPNGAMSPGAAYCGICVWVHVFSVCMTENE